MRAGIIALSIIGALVVAGVVTRAVTRRDRRLEGPRLAELSYREVRFRNEAAGIDLAGLLFLPDDGANRGDLPSGPPVPGAVIIHGSGTSRRDNPWYLSLVAHLQRAGAAVLLPDKRGSEKSGGDWRTASFDELADDAVAAVEFLRAESDVRVGTIGVIGLSQGGQIAPIVASKSSDLGFVVSIVGSAVPLRRQLVYEEHHNLMQMGVPPGLSHLISLVSSWTIVAFRQAEFWTAVGNPDSIPYWERIEVPSLIVLGDRDTNTPTRWTVRRLGRLSNDNIAVRVFTGSGHAIEDPPGEGNDYIRADALKEIADFVHRAADG